jgi:hypothetical protein
MTTQKLWNQYHHHQYPPQNETSRAEKVLIILLVNNRMNCSNELMYSITVYTGEIIALYSGNICTVNITNYFVEKSGYHLTKSL